MTRLEAAFPYIDTHTAGHPTRAILGGVPPLRGRSVLEKRQDFEARFDHLRSALLHEPRGHAAMVGLIPVPSEVADFGAIFISSYVYLGMCGHGTIGFARTLAHTGAISAKTCNSFTLETPAGVVDVQLEWDDAGELRSVSLKNVPAYMGLAGFEVEVEGPGLIRTDILYSGMWYAMVPAAPLGLSLEPDNVSACLALGWKIKQAIAKATEGLPELRGLPAPSVLFHSDLVQGSSRQLLVLAPNKYDRSPCGTGTCARMAQLLMQGELTEDATYRAENIFGVPFTATLAGKSKVQGTTGYSVVVRGEAFLTSQGTLYLEKGDPLSGGFLGR
ncbi:proline racemase family protein [Fuscibacter oryzae]|uniref:Proline racemase family protein n=1 Tax=Fuscibacter oryzae TaxID=2803939 RepID=A0A8J7SWT7_9RHOB|nr:proline racemase family protein [Fuscibacter oryzae]MBL4930016.1 proline racemase family protein [Fuscibacter oryzae]